MHKTLRLAYFLGAFPKTSETFVLHQLAGAVVQGNQIEIHAYQAKEELQHQLFQIYGLFNSVYYRPVMPEHKVQRLCKAGVLMLGLLLWDARHTLKLCSLLKEMKMGEWLELIFLAWPLKGGKLYDVIHAHFGPNGLMAVRLRQAGFLQGKIVTSFHGFDANVVPNMLGKDYYGLLFKKGDAFVVSSEFMYDRLLTLGCEDAKIKQIPVGIDVDQWCFSKRTGLIGKYPVLVSVGRLVEVKGFTYAIQAMLGVRKAFPDVQYHIYGAGMLHDSLTQQIDELGLADCVHLRGSVSQEDLITTYQHTDILLMPSVRAVDGAEEAQGMVLLEAQAAGVPILASNIGGIPESVAHDTALLPEKDVQAWEVGVIGMLQRLQVEGYDGGDAWIFVKQTFDIHPLNEKTFELYKTLE